MIAAVFLRPFVKRAWRQHGTQQPPAAAAFFRSHWGTKCEERERGSLKGEMGAVVPGVNVILDRGEAWGQLFVPWQRHCYTSVT